MIDTAAAIRDLENAGADPKLAEAIVTMTNRRDQDLATRQDVENLDVRLTARIDTLAATVTAQITDLRADILTAFAVQDQKMAALRVHAMAVGIAVAGVLFAAIAALRLL